ncbi:MAG: MBL fold metallo-hydrolase [Chloroflexi bacterium]|nr:MBL fold metallo-hydrolase [Chloroflexota bacterium]
MFSLGNGVHEVHLLNAGLTYVDSGGAFGLVPQALWSRYQTPRDNYLVPMCLNNLLIKSGGKNILVDTGMGSKMPPKLIEQWHLTHPNGTLFEGLERLGLQPEDIDMVINTHLHADHCENNTRFDAEGNIVPSFPNAEHVVQQREYDDATHPNERTRATYVSVNFEPLMQHGQLRLLDGDTDIVPGVSCVVTPGHTPGHMSVRVSAEDEHILFTCDLATYAIHFQKLAWMTAYDVEPLVTMETKRHWQRWALVTNAILIFPHDTTMLAARLVEDDRGKPVLSPITEAEGACYS